MSRVTRMLKNLQMEFKNKRQKPGEDLIKSPDSLDMSSIEKTSFLQGEQYSSHGNPLHSTALEDDFSPEPGAHPGATATRKVGENRVQEKGQDTAGTPKRPAQFVKGQAERNRKSRVQEHPKNLESKKSQRLTSKTQQGPTSRTQRLGTVTESVEEVNRKTLSVVSEAAVSEDENSSAQKSNDATPAKSQPHASLSSEDITDEDESFHPSSGKRKSSRVSLQGRSASSSGHHQQKGQKQKRMSSSSSSENDNLSKKQKRGAGRSTIDLHIVLEAFQEFVAQYKETVESNSVKQAIDAFSHSFEEQLTEKITATTELNHVIRKAAKINRTLNHKKTRLLESKNELIRSKAEVRKLQKDHDELEQRLKSLRQGTEFLINLKEVNQKYLEYRVAHPDEPETYGPSSMPAMLLEARSIMGAGNQLKMINDQMQQALEENGHK